MASQPDRSMICVYPIYINSKKTIAEGRRIPVEKAVENPTLQEMVDCCTYLKLNFKSEPQKGYSRDYMQRGRLKVQIKNADGSFANPIIKTRRELMLKLASLIPKHQTRQRKDQAQAQPSTSATEKKKSGKKKK